MGSVKSRKRRHVFVSNKRTSYLPWIAANAPLGLNESPSTEMYCGIEISFTTSRVSGSQNLRGPCLEDEMICLPSGEIQSATSLCESCAGHSLAGWNWGTQERMPERLKRRISGISAGASARSYTRALQRFPSGV